MDRAAFLGRFGSVYEHSPWVAEAVWDQGMRGDDPLALAGPMALVVDHAGHDRQLTLLRAHPDLAGRLAVGEALTAASTAEQAGAGLDRCSPEEFAAFTRLNDAYRDKFRFPFILAVKGHDRASVLDSFRKRIVHDEHTEFAEALRQVHRIAGFRLETLAGDDA